MDDEASLFRKRQRKLGVRRADHNADAAWRAAETRDVRRRSHRPRDRYVRAIGRHAVSGAEVVLNEDYVLTISPFPSYAGETTEETVVVPMSFPPDSEPGTYTVIGELIQARLRLVVWVEVTSQLPSEQVLGTITLAPELLWIAVTPVDASVAAGLTQQFTATGTYTDGSTEDLTATATWDSSDADVAAT